MALSFTTKETKETKKYTLTIEGMAVELDESTAQEVINLISKSYTFKSVAKIQNLSSREKKKIAPITGVPIFEGNYKMITYDSNTNTYYCYIKAYRNNIRFAIKNDIKNNYGVVFDGNYEKGDFKYKFPNKDMAFKAISETIKHMNYSSEEERAKDLAKYEVKTSNRGRKKKTEA